MTTYAFRTPSGDVLAMFPEFAPPVARHALTAAAEAARAAVRASGLAQRVERQMQALVVTVPAVARPAVEVAPLERSALSRNPAVIFDLASKLGFTVQALSVGGAIVVEGYRLAPRKEGFRASWVGATPVATWHEPLRFEMVDDDRPVKVAEKTRTALAGSRAAGVDTRHLSQVASPHGVSLGVTALIARLRNLEVEG